MEENAKSFGMQHVRARLKQHACKKLLFKKGVHVRLEALKPPLSPS